MLPAFLALGLALSGALPARAGGDTDPPVLAAFDFTPTTVNVSTAQKKVVVTVRAVDASGTTNPIVTLESDTSVQQVGPIALDWDPSSPVTNSVWSADVMIPQGATPGTWTVTLNPLVDIHGNGEVAPHVHPTRLHVTNPGADITPPALESFTFSPQTIDVRTAPKDVVVKAHITDASGVDPSSVIVMLDSDTSSDAVGPLQMSRVSGTNRNGVWRAKASFPIGAFPGAWTVSMFPILDTVGNSDNTGPVNSAKVVVYHPSMKKCLGHVVDVDLRFGQRPTNGPDVILGTPRPDRIDGLGGDDIICGVKSNDIIRGGPGNDLLNGGIGGGDTVSYENATRPVTVSLSVTGPQRTGRSSGRDTLAGFEKILGGKAGDRLTGDNDPNLLTGGPGRDELIGLGGRDRLFGGPGNDYCNGGAGPDRAVACERRRLIP